MGMSIDELIQGIQIIKAQAEWDYPLDWQIVLDGAIDIMRKYQELEQEPTTKNDLAVDKLLAGCEKMSFEIEIFNKPLRVVALDAVKNIVKGLPSVTPQEPKCKDCKWWKDSDGEYRRGCGAESQCPINCKEVFEGNGYCFLFEPQESEGMTREEAIKLLTQYIDYDAETPDYYKMEEACKVAIKALEQEPKTGKWISTETKGVRYAFWCRYKCSLCGGLSDHTNFCPNCGARMVEPQESEDK